MPSFGSSSRRRVFLVVALLAADAALSFSRASAHEVPAELTVKAFLVAGPSDLKLLIRVPLSGLLNARLPKEGPGYLALRYIDEPLRDTTKLITDAIELRNNGVTLGPPSIAATRISLPLDRSFDNLQAATALMAGPPLPPDTQVFWQQGFVDAVVDYAVQRPADNITLHAKLTPLAPKVTTEITLIDLQGRPWPLRLDDDAGTVRFAPRWYQAISTFMARGISDGIDFGDLILFAAGFAIPALAIATMRRALLGGASGFCAAVLALILGHAVASGWWISCLDAVISLSILTLAVQNVSGVRAPARVTLATLIMILLGARLSIVLNDQLQFAGDHVGLASIAYAVGVVGAIAAWITAFVAAALLATRVVADAGVRMTVFSAAVALVAWRGLLDRLAVARYLDWAQFDPGTANDILAWLIGFTVAAAAAWVVAGVVLGRAADSSQPETA